MGHLLKLVTAGAVSVIAYKAWQRRQALETSAAGLGSTPPHGDPLRGTLQSDSRERQQALGALAVFNEQERTLAQLAVMKGVVGEVLNFARKMDQAHSAALTDLSRFAPDRSGTLAQAALAGAERARVRLEALHGQEFETEYLQLSVDSHEHALELLDTQLPVETLTGDLGKEVKRLRKLIAEHLEHARKLTAVPHKSH
ncbi:DUF4142 domain-containing protein [Xanthomonas maliensis]|uniref:DUF4142 domain-containing protein n=1 Tax=Xanthomonas maliensis TaxID=1321368 RepID=UPI00039F2BCE|nr:DUF4142 domain-containing protein [Xanthomonas maliensis]KAB7771528.1 DUF4142 domain-containing protein [Xanthomonas maliensis]